jgi:hypothetical protein
LTLKARFLLLACPVLLGACGLFSFEQLRVTTFPSERNQVISPTDTIFLDFSIPPDRAGAESLLRITSDKGTQNGDLAWAGNRLTFTPVPPLPLNVRHVLSFSGELDTTDGRSFAVAIEVPFFVGSAAQPPSLTDHQPADGATAGVSTPLALTFSDPMDADSFQQGFTLDPSTDFQVTWSADQKVATISPRDRWSSLALYTWEVRDTVRATSGARLGLSHSGSFLVQEDGAAPAVVDTQPAIFQGDVFSFPGGTLNDLRARDCIYIRFSEAVSLDKLQDAFSLDPSIRGHFLQAGPNDFAFVPEENYQMGATHHLVISTGLEDLAGNAMAADYHEWFLPSIPVLEVQSITPFGQQAITTFNTSDPVAVTVAPGGELKFTIEFSADFDPESMASVPFLIACENYFPDSFVQPELRQAAWPNPNTLEVIFTGLATAVPPAHCYYRLTLPGGLNGIANADGSYLKENVWVFLVE